jgi:hypothetical protein
VLYCHKERTAETDAAYRTHGTFQNVNNIFITEREDKRKWKRNIKTGLKEAECEGMGWISFTQDEDLFWAALNTRKDYRGSVSGGKFLDYVRVKVPVYMEDARDLCLYVYLHAFHIIHCCC